MLVLSLAGLRGGTAFALALRWDNDATRIAPIETLTMGVILLTLCGAGESRFALRSAPKLQIIVTVEFLGGT